MVIGPLERFLWSQKSESIWGFWFSHYTKTNIQQNIKSDLLRDFHVSHSCSAASAALQLVAANKSSLTQRIGMTACEGWRTMENTHLCCFENAATDASIMFSLSFLNGILFGEAAAAFQPALFCMVSLQEHLVYQLSSNSFLADFFSAFLLVLFNYSLHPPWGCFGFLSTSWKIYWSRLFLLLKT